MGVFAQLMSGGSSAGATSGDSRPGPLAGPAATIAKYAVVRPTRAPSATRLRRLYATRPDGLTDLWSRLRELAGTDAASATFVEAAEAFLENGARNRLEIAGLDLASEIERYDEAASIVLRSAGFEKVAEQTRARYADLFATETARDELERMVLHVWDRLAANMVASRAPNDSQMFVRILKLLHVAGLLIRPDGASDQPVDVFDAEVLIPPELLDFVERAQTDPRRRARAAREEQAASRAASTVAMVADMVGTLAAMRFVEDALMNGYAHVPQVDAIEVSDAGAADMRVRAGRAAAGMQILQEHVASAPAILTAFLRDSLGIGNLADQDAVALSGRLRTRLTSLSARALGGAGPSTIAKAGAALEACAAGVVAGEIANLEDAAKSSCPTASHRRRFAACARSASQRARQDQACGLWGSQDRAAAVAEIRAG